MSYMHIYFFKCVYCLLQNLFFGDQDISCISLQLKADTINFSLLYASCPSCIYSLHSQLQFSNNNHINCYQIIIYVFVCVCIVCVCIPFNAYLKQTSSQFYTHSTQQAYILTSKTLEMEITYTSFVENLLQVFICKILRVYWLHVWHAFLSRYTTIPS